MDLLQVQIIDGPVPVIAGSIAVVCALYLLIRRPSVRWIAAAVAAVLGGVLVAVVVILVVNAADVFGAPLPLTADIWAAVTFAAIAVAIVNLWRSRWWRKLIAVVSIVVFVATDTVAINAYYGLNPTVGAMFGIVASDPIAITKPIGEPTADPSEPLYVTWKAPADLPKKGKTGTQIIPGAGFDARPAGIYLPPAALVKNPPPLPLVIFMMGYPGNPDPQYIAGVLDNYAAAHQGLAPIAIVADQIGTKGDPACADSAAYGKAQTYITRDVVAWAKANLRILRSPKYWAIGGYSNGGACAFKFGAQEPDVWGNILVVSGDEYPGVESVAKTTTEVFRGSTAAFDAAKPTSILQAKKGRYATTTAVFTVGGNDPAFIPGVKRDADAAEKAGMSTTYTVIPGAGHVVDALNGGLLKDFEVLYPRMGLSRPQR